MNIADENIYIKASDLKKSFKNHEVVSGISLEVKSGEVLGILGPNGVGKTTTMRMLTGFLHPDSGEISISGYDIMQEPEKAKARIGYLAEGTPLYHEMTAFDFLKFSAESHGLIGDSFEKRLLEVKKELSLNEVMAKPLGSLSKGFKRRVGLAQAILHDPEILILDEPTDGLDPIQKRDVKKLIKRISKKKAIIISTHILEEVQAICDSILLINDGKIIREASVESFNAQGSASIEEFFMQAVEGA